MANCKELEKAIGSHQTLSSIPTVREKLNLLKETVEDTKDNFILSKDSDAKTGLKSADSSFFGYKTHIAMTEERIITAATVTSGEKGTGRSCQSFYRSVGKTGSEWIPLSAMPPTRAKTRSYSETIRSDLHQEQMTFQETDQFKEKARHMYKMEAKNGELKNVHGCGRAIAYGINGMQIQGALAIFTVNLKRILKLAI